MPHVLHIIPRSAESLPWQGSAKDVATRTAWLAAHIPDYRRILVDDDDPAAVLRASGTARVDAALVEYTGCPRIMTALREAGTPLVAVRAHNCEPMQHFDNNEWRDFKRLPRLVYGMARLLQRDIRCKRQAHVVLSINAWENRVYWSRLPGGARVEWLPYHCPEALLPAQPLPYEERRIIACLSTSLKNRKSWDAVVRFQRFAEALTAAGADYEFAVTGDRTGWGLPDCRAVKFTGFVDDLAAFHGRCRAMVMLSPLGYGFKTTIGDALAAGASVMAHPALIRRCPQPVRPALIEVDTDRLDRRGIEGVLHRLAEPPVGATVHAELVRLKEGVMNAWFGHLVSEDGR